MRLVLLIMAASAPCVTAKSSDAHTQALLDKWTKAFQHATSAVFNHRVRIEWPEGENACLFQRQSAGSRQWYRCDFDSAEVSEASHRPKPKPDARKINPSRQHKSPDGRWTAYTKKGAVFLKNNATGKETMLATPDTPRCYYEGKPDWNETSSHFIITHCTPGQRRTVTLVESSPKDSLQPKVHTFRYDKPGDRIDRREPRTIDISHRNVHKPDLPLTKTAYQLNHAAWLPGGKEMIYEYVERGFGKHYLIARNITTGKERIIVKEQSDTFIYVNNTRFRKILPDSHELIWASERDGWRHLYLIDLDTGHVKNRITSGPWIVRGQPIIDVNQREIIFSASGKNKGEDPYHIHWYKIRFDGSKLIRLTHADGTHALRFSPDRKHYVDTWSRVDHPPVHELRRTRDGKLIKVLAKADASRMANQGRSLPKRFVCKDRNGRFDIWGVIYTPPNYDPRKKYPVVENIYAGPHGAFVQKKFTPWIRHINELTESGFVVVQIDGLGTNYRHRDFSHFSYKNLVDAGLPDRIKWIKAAAQKYPVMDTSRVGIYGGSAGGQSAAAAVLHHGNFYKAAAADCGCHDNRMDKLWWNEQWMDWPVAKHYGEQSNITNAHKLSGALMLTVGELDKNVDPASTTQFVAALIKADKDFEYHILPGGGHGSGETAYLRRKRVEFFQRHLGAAR